MKSFIIKNKKTILTMITILCFVLIFLLIGYYQLDKSEQNYVKGYELNEKDYKNNRLSSLSKGSVVQQEFRAKYNNLEKIILKMEIDKQREYLGNSLKATIKDLQGNIIKEEIISYDELAINPEYELVIDKQKDSKGKKYLILIELDNADNKNSEEEISAVKLKDSKSNLKEVKLKVNEDLIEGSIFFVDLYYSNIRAWLFNITTVFISILAVVMSAFIYTRKEISAEKAFLIIVPVLCILFLIYMPLFRSHDEYGHWLRSYEISEGKWLPEVRNGVIGSELPKSVAEIYTNQNTYKDIRYSSIKGFWEEEIDSKDRAFVDTSVVSNYSPIQYFPQAIGIVLARVVTSKTVILAYTARIANLLTTMTLMYFAIKKIPFGKTILLILAVIPIAIEGFSSISADGLIISASYLFIAYVLHLKFDNVDRIKIKDKLILFILMVVIALCKTVYIPLVLLLFLIPKKIFKNNRERWITIIVISLIAVALNFSWLMLSNANKIAASRNIATEIKVNGILQNPMSFLQILLYSINANGNSYILTTFGWHLGWTSINIFYIVPYSLILLLCASITDHKIKNRLNKWEIINFMIIALGVMGATFLALYTTWTSITSDVITGVQGRYFLPILPLLCLAVGSALKIESKYKEENMIKFVSIATIILQINVILTLTIVHLK